MLETIRLQARLMRGPDQRTVLIIGSVLVAALASSLWFLTSTQRMMAWAALALVCLLLIPILWREGYTWVILWLAPVAAVDPFPSPMIRAAKYGLVLAAVAIALMKRRIRPQTPARFDRKPFYPAMVLLLWFWIRAATGSAPVDGIVEAARLTLVAALLYLWLTEPEIPGGRRRWFHLWLILGLYEVGACVVQSVLWGKIRSYGTLASANAVGIFLIVTITLVFAASVWAPSLRTRIISRVSLPLLLFSLYLTGSRASWLATGIAAVIIVLVTRRWRLLALGLAALGLLFTVYLTNPVVQFAADAALRLQGGLTERPLLWEAADRAIPDAPIIGFGVKAAGSEMRAEARYPSAIHRRILEAIMAAGSPHNFYREIILETGLIGLALLIATILALIHFAATRLRSPDPWRATYALALLAGTIAIAVHSYFERSVFMGSMSEAVFFWFVVTQTARPDDPPRVAA